ncbi:MAG: efflux RND transporter periplasmic adaptor subunit [Bacteroidales bacterium]
MIRLSFLLLLPLLFACNNGELKEVPTTYVRKGTFTEELTEEGTLRAVNSIAINAPRISYRYGGLKITSMVEDGKEVHKGDTLIIFDLSEIQKAIVENEQLLVVANAELDKMIATHQSAIDDLEADMEVARISREISKINFEQSEYEADVTKQEIALKLENANIALERSREQIENRKRINQEDLFQKKLSIKQLQDVLDEANSSVNSLFVVSPANGIAILEENWMTQQKWQVGEQPYSGSKLIELPDLDNMMAEIKINEVDVSKILPEMEVTIITDAYSDTTYQGKVTSIANLAQNKDNTSKIKVFPVEISISGTSEKLLPGLTVSCKIKIKEIHDVLYIPFESLFREQADEFVYVKTSSGFRRQDVKTGTSNTDFTVVTEGLQGDEELALSDPFISSQDQQ